MIVLPYPTFVEAVDDWIRHAGYQAMFELARDLRYSVVQSQYDAGNLTEHEALELLRGPLSPDDPSTVCDDSSRLVLKQNDVMLV